MFVASVDEEGSKTKLGHGHQRHEQEEPPMVANRLRSLTHLEFGIQVAY